MRRRPNVVVVAAALTIGLLGVGLAPDAAGARLASAKSAKGTTMCFVSGTITAKPALTLGSGKATVLTFSATLSNCTGSAAAKITHGTLTGKSVDTSASCVAFENAFPALAAKVSYKTSGGSLAPTVLSFSAGTLNFKANPLSISYPKSGGKGTAKGSFASKHATMMLNLSVPYTTWVSTCQGASGLATMNVISTSSVTL
jgi:hypothetical protein